MKSCHVTLCYIVVLRRNYFYYSYWIEKLYGRVIGCAVTFVQLALVLATLGTPVLEPNLNPRLAQTESLAKFFPHERVRVMGLVEQSFQLGQLFQGEIRSRSSLFPVSVPVVPAIRPWKKIFQILMILLRKRKNSKFMNRSFFNFSILLFFFSVPGMSQTFLLHEDL